jgi:hypothetical protein
LFEKQKEMGLKKGPRALDFQRREKPFGRRRRKQEGYR